MFLVTDDDINLLGEEKTKIDLKSNDQSQNT